MLDPAEKSIGVKASRPTRWTISRVLTVLAIIVIAVRLVLIALVPEDRLPAVPRCGTTEENGLFLLALIFLALKPVLKGLQILNQLDRYLPNHAPEPKPEPLDDF